MSKFKVIPVVIVSIVCMAVLEAGVVGTLVKQTLKVWDITGGLKKVKVRDTSAATVRRLADVGANPVAAAAAAAAAAAKANAASRPSLTISPMPSDARVRIMNISPSYKDGMTLKKGGEYDVLVQAEGYRLERFWVTLDESIDIAISLKKKEMLDCSPQEIVYGGEMSTDALLGVVTGAVTHDPSYTYQQNLGEISYTGAYFGLAELLDARGYEDCILLEKQDNWLFTKDFAQINYYVNAGARTSNNGCSLGRNWKSDIRNGRYTSYTYGLEKNKDNTVTLIAQANELSTEMIEFKTRYDYKSEFCEIVEAL
jgi:hypothetical protein